MWLIRPRTYFRQIVKHLSYTRREQLSSGPDMETDQTSSQGPSSYPQVWNDPSGYQT